MIRNIFSLLIITLILSTRLFANDSYDDFYDEQNDEYYEDQDDSFYTDESVDLRSCSCFFHCRCLENCDLGDPKPDCCRNNLINLAWHEFMGRIIKARKMGPFILNGVGYESLVNYNRYDLNIHSVSDYLNILKKFRRILEKARNDNAQSRNLRDFWPREKAQEQYDAYIKRNEEQYQQALHILDEIPDPVFSLFLQAVENCPHNSSFGAHNKGLIHALYGRWDISLAVMQQHLSVLEAKQVRYIDANIYQGCGAACLEMNLFDEAIEALTKAIQIDPKNKQNYFYRASAYFEMGQFDRALEDYLLSDRENEVEKSPFQTQSNASSVFIISSNDQLKSVIKQSDAATLGFGVNKEFTIALLIGLQKGLADAAIDFVPNLCATTYGMGKTLWSASKNPIEASKQFVSACYEVGEHFFEYCKTLDKDTIDALVDQLKIFYQDFSELSDAEKGSLIGYTIGKYGLEILAPTAVFKSVSAYQKLKNANRVCNFEAMIVSNADKEAIIASSMKHAAERNTYFKNIKLEVDKQNKHIPGKHNFRLNNSEFMHPDPEGLLSNFAGKGKSINNKMPGVPDYRERVDFHEFIGYYIDDLNPEVKLPTTKGTIRYSKKGAHIVPSHPNGN